MSIIEDVQQGTTRETATSGVLIIKARMSYLFGKAPGSELARIDTMTREDVKMARETLKGTFYTSPSGTYVYCLKPATVKGAKMIRCVAAVPVSSVIDFVTK